MKSLKISFVIVLAITSICYNAFAQTIYDIQYVDPSGTSDVSAFVNQVVTTSGIVTASAETGNLDAVFIQQAELTEWAGIQLKPAAALIPLKVGDLVSITGTVVEESGLTKLSNISDVEVTGSGTIIPTPLDPNIFTTWSIAENEKYEGMLVALQNAPDFISVVNANPDDPNNFGEWRVGSIPTEPDSGCRILTGRQTSQITSSLNVSYVNDEAWANNSGTMQVNPIVVQNGDEFFGIVGLMTYSFGNILCLPRNNEDITTEATSGLNKINQQLQSINIYPNPISNYIILEFELINKGDLKIDLYNLEGKIIRHLAYWENIQEGQHKKKLDFQNNLPPGNYLLSFKSSQYRITHQISIQ